MHLDFCRRIDRFLFDDIHRLAVFASRPDTTPIRRFLRVKGFPKIRTSVQSASKASSTPSNLRRDLLLFGIQQHGVWLQGAPTPTKEWANPKWRGHAVQIRKRFGYLANVTMPVSCGREKVPRNRRHRRRGKIPRPKCRNPSTPWLPFRPSRMPRHTDRDVWRRVASSRGNRHFPGGGRWPDRTAWARFFGLRVSTGDFGVKGNKFFHDDFGNVAPVYRPSRIPKRCGCRLRFLPPIGLCRMTTSRVLPHTECRWQ